MSLIQFEGKQEKPKGKIIDRRGEEREEKTPTPQATMPIKETYPPIPEAPNYRKINLSMRGDRMLIQPFPHAEKIGRIFTPTNVELAIDKGRVVAVGPGVKKIKVGDVIYKVAGLGQMLLDNAGNGYIFLPENAAIAVDTDYRRKWWQFWRKVSKVEQPILMGNPDMPSTARV